MAKTARQRFYLFGRLTYQQPLAYVDQLSVEDPGNLAEAAWSHTGEVDWVELVAIPERAIIRVIPEADNS